MGCDENKINIVIVGGGSAGWMTAAALSKFLPVDKYSLTLVESEQIGTVGVGEATIPHIRYFNSMLGIDENEFITSTSATYKLAICFENWGGKNSVYYHPFGMHGFDINGIEFHHYFLKLKQAGVPADFDNYAAGSMASRLSRFAYPLEKDDSWGSSYSYAFHLDAGLYANYLRKFAEKNGVDRIEGEIVKTNLDSEGNLQSILLKSQKIIAGDLFIDCSGFRSLLLNDALGVGFDDWSQWLKCDRAVALPSTSSIFRPYTRSIAHEEGWQWQIPLQHRTGNGYVYSSSYISDDEAIKKLLNNIEGEPLAEPRVIKFKAGRYHSCWQKNCVAIGLSSGFLEPLESTSLYLIQIGIMNLLEFMPEKSINSVLRDEYNEAMDLEYLRIRDFIILHYYINKLPTPFWDECRNMDVPKDLKQKIQLFKHTAQIEKYQKGLFMTPSWLSVYFGQGEVPRAIDPRVNQMDIEKIKPYLHKMENDVKSFVESMPAAKPGSHSSGVYTGAASMSLYKAR